MFKKAGWVGAALTMTALTATAPILLSAGSAQAAVVYCKTVGVPKGCVARPGAPVVAAETVGVGVAGVGVGAPGVGVRPGTPLNRGGPVDRVGRR